MLFFACVDAFNACDRTLTLEGNWNHMRRHSIQKLLRHLHLADSPVCIPARDSPGVARCLWRVMPSGLPAKRAWNISARRPGARVLEWRMPLPPVLDRFLEAQESVWARVLVELKVGKKRSHWMWFVFPQIKGLGHSDMAARYAIQSRVEAKAYLGHPVLGSRLREACNALLALENLTAHEILGTPDDLKLRSSMTLFAEVSEPGDVFGAVLEKYFDGKRDARTLALLG